MAKINYKDLISHFQYALDNKWGYIWGTSGGMHTQAAQNQIVAYFQNKYGSNWVNNSAAKNEDKYNAAKLGSKWIGHRVADCSGLFVYAFKQHGQTIYHGSNSIWKKNALSSKGDLKNGLRTDGQELKPGTAVFVYKSTGDNYSHIGLYVGNGTVIEAQGTSAGVTTTQITNSKWNKWGELADVNYSDTQEIEVKIVMGETYKVVAETGSTVRVRASASTSAVTLGSVTVGSTIGVTEKTNNEWYQVDYNGKVGYMMAKFLTQVEIQPAASVGDNGDTKTIILTLSVAQALADALRAAGV